MSSVPTSASGSTLSRRQVNQASVVPGHGTPTSSSTASATGASATAASGRSGSSPDVDSAKGCALNPLAKEFVPAEAAASSSVAKDSSGSPSSVSDTNGGVKSGSLDQESVPDTTQRRGGLSAALKRGEQGKASVKMGHSGVDHHISTPASGGRRGQTWNANHLLNFQYDPIVRPAPRPQQRRQQQKIQAYDKELFLQANFRFLVSDLGDYMENSTDPDKMLQWEDIALVELSSSVLIQCPICLDNPPLCPQITSCGHIFCFPCILRYFMDGEEKRGDHWKKCPLCFTMTSCKELRTVYIHNVKQYKVGDKIQFTLLTRAKGSVIPLQSNESWGSLAHSNDGRCHLYSKFTLTSDMEKTTMNAVSELTTWAEKAQAGDLEELGQMPYVFVAIDMLKMRKAAWDEHRTMEFISSSPPVKQRIMAQVKAGITKLPGITAGNEDAKSTAKHQQKPYSDSGGSAVPANNVSKEVTGYRVNPFTDERELVSPFKELDHGVEVPDEWECISTAPVKHGSAEKEKTASAQKQEETDSYSFYQAADGQLIILHPVSMKCLVHHYGSYKSLPTNLEATILDMETVGQTETSRKRYRYLSHLPLTSMFQLCEVDLFEILPSSSLSPFKDELRSRDTRRQRRLEQERRLKSVEQRASEREMPPSPSDFIAIMNALHDDEVPVSADFADTIVSPVTASKPPVDDRKLFSRVTKLGYAAGHDAPDLTSAADGSSNSLSGSTSQNQASESGTLNAGRSSVLSFADVIQKEKEKTQEAPSRSGNNKGKKASRVLLSTAGGRRY